MNSRGFTLVELMVVASIIALLTSVVLTSLGNSKAKARDTERVQELKALQTALELYRLEFGYPPQPPYGIAKINVAGTDGKKPSNPTLQTALQGLVDQDFLSAIPRPPQGMDREYYYYQTNADYEPDYSCMGKTLSSRSTPYIFYFVAELPQNLPQLTNPNGTPVTNAYCLTI